MHNVETPMRDRILKAARQELAEVGPGALSMRAVARSVGVTVGALYRYFDGRDALLTELIIEAYDSVGAAAERGRVAGSTGAEAWVASCLAVRAWCVEHPHEFALIYGTPVIGYEAPERTVEAATRLIRALVGVLVEYEVLDHLARAESVPAPLEPDMTRIRGWLDTNFPQLGAEQVPDRTLLQVVRSWTELIGTISFELHGHYRGSIENGAAYLEAVAREQAAGLALR